MNYIDPHIHMISRVTDDYQRMAYAGCAAVTEPAFWAGFDRGTVEGFRDYFRHLTEVEPKRAALFNIQHYCWLCINAKEAENVELLRGVIQMIPEFLQKPNVLGVGEIGLNKNTRNEAIVFQEHVDLAMKTDELILIHTPHLEDKYKGTRMIIDMLKGDRRVKPERVLVDHVEEHTVRLALDNGFWCGMTLYPTTKCTPARAVDIIEMVGTDRIMANSAGDWGKSDPLAVPEMIQEMKRRGHPESAIRKVVYENPLGFFRQCARWQDWPIEDEAKEKGKGTSVISLLQVVSIPGVQGSLQCAVFLTFRDDQHLDHLLRAVEANGIRIEQRQIHGKTPDQRCFTFRRGIGAVSGYTYPGLTERCVYLGCEHGLLPFYWWFEMRLLSRIERVLLEAGSTRYEPPDEPD